MNFLICTYLTIMLKLRNSHLQGLPLMELNNSGLHVPGITISPCPQKCGECYSHLDHPHSALSYPVIFTLKFFFFLHDTVLPSVASPSCLQTTAASIMSQLSLQTVPHCPPIQTSTLPSRSSPPPVNLMSVSLQDRPKRHTFRNKRKSLQLVCFRDEINTLLCKAKLAILLIRLLQFCSIYLCEGYRILPGIKTGLLTIQC